MNRGVDGLHAVNLVMLLSVLEAALQSIHVQLLLRAAPSG
jgi:hypothetical protein